MVGTFRPFMPQQPICVAVKSWALMSTHMHCWPANVYVLGVCSLLALSTKTKLPKTAPNPERILVAGRTNHSDHMLADPSCSLGEVE